ncbi:N-formylglutamate deformylase [Sphingomonas sp. G-3-2-10]|uniref:N-formylglutamate deformylase n=1 Tax=Sphingomonas sp. G-3-2-10 TaxID=2728838 RepID=UPI00146F7930|nr:N-formylglutamate deformylase [Sphingomonas sp. G-3-2-10]NML04889.1 N-formylglutamate deformylase [Sphingomonas sp. G-3-2-10]
MIAVHRGDAPLIVSIPHAGTEIPDDLAGDVHSLERARYDADLYIDKLYAFAVTLGATIVRTTLSRTVIDMNRDPSGVSLYPGQTTTDLCPLTTFDGEPLWRPGREPDEAEIARRRTLYFEPYHRALETEIARLREEHNAIVLYEAHSIRSYVPRLFDGELPQFNIGTNSGASCSPKLTEAVESVCETSGGSWITNGRFKGGWTTRHYGQPEKGVHAIQMELAMRGYVDEVGPYDWPPPWNEKRAEACQKALRHILIQAIEFAEEQE